MEFNVNEIISKGLPIILSSLFSILLANILIKLVKRFSDNYEKANGKTTYMSLLVNFIKVIIWIVCAASIGSQFKSFSTTVSALLASSGILALGVSMAAQDSLSNMINGIFISIYQPFNLGDRISLPEENITGTVTSMNLRHTTITTFTNTTYIIANSKLSNCIIENTSKVEFYISPVDISITYDSDIDKASEIMKRVIGSHPAYFDRRSEEDKASGKPLVTVMFKAFGASSIDLRASLVTKSIFESYAALSDIRYQLKKEFDEAGVKFPFNTITVDLPKDNK